MVTDCEKQRQVQKEEIYGLIEVAKKLGKIEMYYGENVDSMRTSSI